MDSREKGPERERNPLETFLAALGAFVGIGIVAYLSLGLGHPMMITSFGATAVILYAMPRSKAARPKTVLVAHFVSALVGLGTKYLLGYVWVAVAIAVSASIAVMILLGTVHPPGGATAMACLEQGTGLSFVLAPVMLGVSVLLVVAFLINRLELGLGSRDSAPSDGFP